MFLISGLSRILYAICLAYVSTKWFLLIAYFIRMKRRKNIRLGHYPALSKENMAVILGTYALSILLIVVHTSGIVFGFLKQYYPQLFSTYRSVMIPYLVLNSVMTPMILTGVAVSMIYLFTYLN